MNRICKVWHLGLFSGSEDDNRLQRKLLQKQKQEEFQLRMMMQKQQRGVSLSAIVHQGKVKHIIINTCNIFHYMCDGY